MVSDREPRSYRGILVALAGLAALFTTFGLGLMLGVLNYPEEQRYQPYRYAADDPTQPNATLSIKGIRRNAKPFEYREPCHNPKGQGESELCAEWRSAKAGEDSAWWAEWSFWITIVGATGLLITINQSRVGLERARDANDIARETAESQLRAYVAVQPGGIHLTSNGQFFMGHVFIKNVGQTFAKHLDSHVWICPSDTKEVSHFGNVPDRREISRALQAGDEMRQGSQDPHIAIGVANMKPYLFVWGIVFYTDAFGGKRTTRFCHRYHWSQKEDGAYAMGNPRISYPPEIIKANKARHHIHGNDAD